MQARWAPARGAEQAGRMIGVFSEPPPSSHDFSARELIAVRIKWQAHRVVANLNAYPCAPTPAVAARADAAKPSALNV